MSSRSDRRLWWIGVGLAAILATVLAQWASRAPDGLEHTAAQVGLVEPDSSDAIAPLPDYAVPSVRSEIGARVIAGVAGVLAALAVGGGLALWLRPVRPAMPERQP